MKYQSCLSFIVIIFISAVRANITEVVLLFAHISMTELTTLFSVVFVMTTHNFLYICIAGVCKNLLVFVENK